MQIHRVLLYMQSNTGDKKKTKQNKNKTKQNKHTHTHTHTQTDLGRPARLHTIESNHLWSAS